MKEYIAIYRSRGTQIFYSFEAETDTSAWSPAEYVRRKRFNGLYPVKIAKRNMIEVLNFIKSFEGIEDE